MIFSKNMPISLLDKNKSQEIFITKDVSLDFNLLNLLITKYPNSKISILTYDNATNSNLQSNITYNNEELKILADNVNKIRIQYDKDITFDEDYTIEQAISANKKINDWADFINSATIDGEQLSPLEKYTLAYSLVSNRVYASENENQSSEISRNLISVMSDDFIVCAGFANILSTLCAQINVPCVFRNCTVHMQDNKWENHANCIVRIEDDKYNIHGFYNSDPTWDAIRPETKKYDLKFNLQFKHFLLSHKDYIALFPNVKLDQMSLSTSTGKRKFAPFEIKSIASLFPEYKPTAKINSEIFDSENNDINEILIKKQILKRLEPIVDNCRGETTELDAEYLQDVCSTIVDYLVQECISKQITEPTEYPEYINNTLPLISNLIKQSDLAEIFFNITNNLSKADLSESYMMAIEDSSPEHNYYLYNSKYTLAKENASEITEEKLLMLFNELTPILCEEANKNDQQKIANILTQKHSPLKLKADLIRQKMQD